MNGPGDLLEEPHLALEERGGAGHAVGGEQRGEDAVARGEGEGTALPHRQLAGAGEPQGGAGRAGDPQGVDGLLVREVPAAWRRPGVAEIEP